MVLQSCVMEAAGLPTGILGLGCNSWRKGDIRKVLDHYDVPRPKGPSVINYSKVELLVMLSDLVTSRNLDNQVRHNLVRRTESVVTATLPKLASNITASSESATVPSSANSNMMLALISGQVDPTTTRTSHTSSTPSSTDSRRVVDVREHSRFLWRRGLFRIRSAKSAAPSTISLGNTARILSTNEDAGTSTSIANNISPDCVACLETLTTANAPQRKITEACNHDPLICLNCLAQSITSQTESKIWDQIDCPTCKARLSHDDVKAFATDHIFQRWVSEIVREHRSADGVEAMITSPL